MPKRKTWEFGKDWIYMWAKPKNIRRYAKLCGQNPKTSAGMPNAMLNELNVNWAKLKAPM
jgi:hypothetical protein